MIIFYWVYGPQGVIYKTWMRISSIERLPDNNYIVAIPMSPYKITISAKNVIAIIGSSGLESISITLP